MKQQRMRLIRRSFPQPLSRRTANGGNKMAKMHITTGCGAISLPLMLTDLKLTENRLFLLFKCVGASTLQTDEIQNFPIIPSVIYYIAIAAVQAVLKNRV